MFVHDDLVALGTENSLSEWGTAPVVDQHGGRFAVGEPAIAPLHERDERGGEVLAFVGEDILKTHGAVLIGHSFEHASVHELAQAIGQEILGNAEIFLELAETTHTAKCITQDEQRPPIADDPEGGSDGAVHLGCMIKGVRHNGCKAKPCRLHFATESDLSHQGDDAPGLTEQLRDSRAKGCNHGAMVLFPAPLRPGDRVRVIAPSTTLSIVSTENRTAATARLERLGLEVSFGQFVDDVDVLSSASTTKRLADLHDAFADPTVDGILTAIGGYNANDLLPHINWDLIASNPKVFCGFSDITVLTSAITTRTGLITFSGQHYSTFAMEQHFDRSLEWFTSVVMDRTTTALDASPTWSDDPWYLDQKDRAIEPNAGQWVLAEGDGTGTVAGGNLCTLNLLQGTDLMPSLADAVLFVEDDLETDAFTFARDLVSLSHQTAFKQIQALVIGRFQRASKVDRSTLEAIVGGLDLAPGVPVVANVDIGHTDPMATIPIGGTARVTAGAGTTDITVRW